MNIILSAYECSPDHGSEAGLGWNWLLSAMHNEKFKKIHLITMDRYQKNILDYVTKNNKEFNNVAFHFIPLPLKRLKKLNQRFKYIVWQKYVAAEVKRISANESIGFVQHVTWATCVLPQFIRGKYPIIYGPIGGGERIPAVVDTHYSVRDSAVEFIRNAIATTSTFLPANRKAYKNAKLILATTDDTKKLVPKKYRDKVHVMSAIGVDRLPKSICQIEEHGGNFIVFLAARMLCWKGIDIALEVFKRMELEYPDVKLRIAGNGRNFEEYKAKATKNVTFIGSVNHSSMQEEYMNADLLLNCSLHDSGCMVVLEAMSMGLPVIAIDTGGPKVLMENSSSIKIKPRKTNDMINDIIGAILKCKDDLKLRQKMSEDGIQCVKQHFMYSDKYDWIIKFLDSEKKLNLLKSRNT